MLLLYDSHQIKLLQYQETKARDQQPTDLLALGVATNLSLHEQQSERMQLLALYIFGKTSMCWSSDLFALVAVVWQGKSILWVGIGCD